MANIGPTFINQVQKPVKRSLGLGERLRERARRYKRRLILGLKMARCEDEMEQLVRELVRVEQTRDNMAFAGKKEEFFLYAGKAEGIAWALKFGKHWKEKLLILLLGCTLAHADTGFNTTIQVTESDNSPKCQAGQLKFSNGTVTCSGQTATITNTGATTTGLVVTSSSVTFTNQVLFSSNVAVQNGLNFSGINSVSANYTVTSTDTFISCSASGGARTITLDAANALLGQHLWIDKSDTSANACTIRAAGSDTIDYTTTTFKLNAQGQGIKLVSDGSANWKAPDGLSATPPFLGYPDAPSAAQTLTANQSQLRAMYIPIPIRATGIRYNEQVQSGNLDVGLYDNSGILLAHSGTTAAPATGDNTTNFASAVNIAPGIYYMAIAVDNATISFAKSSGNGVIGCNNISSNFVLANVTLPGSLTGNCLAMVLTVTGGITQ